MVQVNAVAVEPKEVYLKPTDEFVNEKGVKVYDNGKWVELKDSRQLKPGAKISVDGHVYVVTDQKTDYTVSMYNKYTLADGRMVYELPGKRYLLVSGNSQSSISEARFKTLIESARSVETIVYVSNSVYQHNKQKDKPSQPSEQQKTDPRQEQRATPQPARQEQKPQSTSQMSRQETARFLHTGAYLLSGIDIYVNDPTLYSRTFGEWLDEVDRATGGKYSKSLMEALGINSKQLEELRSKSLAEIMAARRDLGSLLTSKSAKESDLDTLRARYGDALLLVLLRATTGDRNLTLDDVREAIRFVGSDTYRSAHREIRDISARAADQLEQKNILERYYFVKYAWPAIKRMDGMSYVENNAYMEFSLNSTKGAQFLERVLGQNFSNNYLSYRYGLPFMIRTNSSFDNLIAMLSAVEQVNLGIMNNPTALGLNRMEQFRYYTSELPRIVASLYANYAAALEPRLRSGLFGDFESRLRRYTSAASGLRFDQVEEVAKIIEDFVRAGKDLRIPSDNTFGARGNVRASPVLREPQLNLLTQGLILNMGQLISRYNPNAGYFFSLPQEWLDLRGNLYYEATESSARGSGRVELRGTRSYIATSIDDDRLQFLARNIDMLKELRGTVSPTRVEVELEAQLDREFRGANVGVVFRRENGKMEGILYAKIDGNWYRIGRVDNSWLLGMDVVIPGLANAIGEVRVGDSGSVVGSIGIAMPQLSGWVVKTEEDLLAIGAYLLNGNQLAAGTFANQNVTAPNLVYAGFYNGNVLLGGQYLTKDYSISGMGILGNGLGMEVTFGTRTIVLQGGYANFDGLSSVYGAAKATIGDMSVFAAYIASGERMFMGAAMERDGFALQAYRMSKVDPKIFGMYSNFFKDASSFTGAIALWGRNYAELIVAQTPEDLRILLGGGYSVDSVELSGAVGFGNGEGMIAAGATLPIGIWLASAGVLYQSNKLLFSASAQNQQWFFGAAYNTSTGVLVVKVGYGDSDRIIVVYKSFSDRSIGVIGECGFFLNEAIFLSLSAAYATGESGGWYVGARASYNQANSNLNVEIRSGKRGGEESRFTIVVGMVYAF